MPAPGKRGWEVESKGQRSHPNAPASVNAWEEEKASGVMRAGAGRTERQLGSSSKASRAASAIYGSSKLARP